MHGCVNPELRAPPGSPKKSDACRRYRANLGARALQSFREERAPLQKFCIVMAAEDGSGYVASEAQ